MVIARGAMLEVRESKHVQFGRSIPKGLVEGFNGNVRGKSNRFKENNNN